MRACRPGPCCSSSVTPTQATLSRSGLCLQRPDLQHQHMAHWQAQALMVTTTHRNPCFCSGTSVWSALGLAPGSPYSASTFAAFWCSSLLLWPHQATQVVTVQVHVPSLQSLQVRDSRTKHYTATFRSQFGEAYVYTALLNEKATLSAAELDTLRFHEVVPPAHGHDRDYTVRAQRRGCHQQRLPLMGCGTVARWFA